MQNVGAAIGRPLFIQLTFVVTGVPKGPFKPSSAWGNVVCESIDEFSLMRSTSC